MKTLIKFDKWVKKKKWSICGTEEGVHSYIFLILSENQAKEIILLISLVAALLSLPILEWSMWEFLELLLGSP